MKNVQTETIEKSNGILTNYLKDKLKDVHLGELLKGSSIAFIMRIIGMIFSYIFTLVITRNFGADAMGVFALSFTALSIFSIIGRLGVDTALLRFVAEYSAQDRWDLVKEIYIKSMKIVIPFCLILSLVLYILSPYMAKYIFHKEYLSPYFRIISFAVLPMVLILINSNALRALKKIKESSFFQNISNFLFASIILVALVFFTNQLYIPIVSYVIALFLGAIVSQISWQKNAKLGPVAYKKTTKLKTVLYVSLPMLLSSSMFFIMHWIDTIMLGILKTEAEVGVYNIVLKVATLTNITLVAINTIAAPKFAEFYSKGDMAGLGKTTRQSTKLIFWTSFPTLIVIFLFPSLILGIFGEEFRAGIYALLFLTFGQFINSISGSVALILQMTGKQKVFQNIMLIATVINVILNAILIPRYGIDGAAFASMISVIFWNLASVFYIKQYLNVLTVYIPIINYKNI
ncbi:MAG: flippase [Candidatus Brocadia sp.]|nr:flippase [Candidatus Brocadia sp.]